MKHDLVSDLLARICNAQSVGKNEVTVLRSRHSLNVLDVMLKEGLIRGFKACGNKQSVEVFLKYSKNLPAITSIRRVSKPSRRFYVQAKSLWKLNKGLGLYILSTPKGVIVDRDARRLNVGGEVICKIM
jgi:small subunit ribosomal protein S8